MAKTTKEVPELLTEEEAARVLKREVHTLRNWRWARKGPPYSKIEGAVLYPAEQLVEWISERTVTAKNSARN